MKRLIGLLFVLLAACATTPQTPAQTVYVLQSNYAAALTVAVKYKALPPCDAAGTLSLCSRPEIVARIQKADDVAFPALKSAQNVVRREGAGANVNTAIMAADQAVAALTAITATLGVK